MLKTFLSLAVFISFYQFNCPRAIDLNSLSVGSMSAQSTEDKAPILITDEAEFDKNEISLKFQIPEGESYNAITEGCLLKNSSIHDNTLTLGVYASSEESSVVVQSGSGSTTAYMYTTDDTTYVSDASMDTAIEECDPDLIGNEFIVPINPNPTTPVILNHTIYGTLYWTDDSNNSHPLYKAKLTAAFSSGNISAITNESGYFCLNCTDYWDFVEDDDYTLTLSLESSFIKAQNSLGNVYSVEIAKSHIVGTDTKQVSFTILPPTSQLRLIRDFSKATVIFEGLNYYAKHAKELIGSRALPQCTLSYPCATSYTSSNLYLEAGHTIYISDSTTNNRSIKSYNAWDAIGHEYGHHLESCFDLADLVGGNHFAGENDCNTLYESTEETGRCYHNQENAFEYGLKLAWAESWPTFWATVAQQSFPNEYKISSLFSVSDDLYYAGNFGYISEEEPDYQSLSDENTNDIDGSGEGCELSIIRFLYNLWDSENSQKDVFTVSEQDFWNIVFETNASTFYDFYLDFISDHSFRDTGLLLDAYNICAGNVHKINESRFIWTLGIDCSSYHMDTDSITFYDFDYNILFSRIPNSETSDYYPTAEEWSILNSQSVYYIDLTSTARVGNLESGTYYSPYYQIINN